MQVDNCIFCKIAKGEIKSQKVYEDQEIIAFLDINPVNKGHVLVVPKDHYETIFDIPKEKLSKVIEVVQKVAIALRKMGADGINIISNNGKAAEQHIFHLHIHVIPRYFNDGKDIDAMSKRAKYNDEKEMSDYAEKIRLFLI
ncbi:HIT family protein [Sulfolobus sp. S-194]|uniref:HIT family protein n=1 Tax=Sulfolobus sp. S-194 TaxID=2512240 RepID=UPI001436DC69|nr:HIT family protein [Sulfolobus sp. S-194]QIW24350.1 HIT family protein [Sulfolobus sp. S-194]